MDFKKRIRIESSQCSGLSRFTNMNVSKSSYICHFSLNVAEVQVVRSFLTDFIVLPSHFVVQSD